MEVNFTSELIAAIAASVISLAFSYIPGLNNKFAALDSEVKRAIMAGIMIVVAGAVYGLGCAGIINAGITCDTGGIWKVVWLLIVAIMANQSTYKISPQVDAVKYSKPLEYAVTSDEVNRASG